MMNLAEYRNRNRRLADFLPWVALVGTGIVLNKDVSFQRTASFRGPDLDSAVPAELVAVAGRLNNAFRRLGSGWAIFVEAQRHAAGVYPANRFPDAASASASSVPASPTASSPEGRNSVSARRSEQVLPLAAWRCGCCGGRCCRLWWRRHWREVPPPQRAAERHRRRSIVCLQPRRGRTYWRDRRRLWRRQCRQHQRLQTRRRHR